MCEVKSTKGFTDIELMRWWLQCIDDGLIEGDVLVYNRLNNSKWVKSTYFPLKMPVYNSIYCRKSDFEAIKFKNWPKDKKIYVSMEPNENWYKRHFAYVTEDNRIAVFEDGRTSWTTNGVTFWNYAKEHEDLI